MVKKFTEEEIHWFWERSVTNEAFLKYIEAIAEACAEAFVEENIDLVVSSPIRSNQLREEPEKKGKKVSRRKDGRQQQGSGSVGCSSGKSKGKKNSSEQFGKRKNVRVMTEDAKGKGRLDEMSRLKMENAVLKQENEALKKENNTFWEIAAQILQ